MSRSNPSIKPERKPRAPRTKPFDEIETATNKEFLAVIAREKAGEFTIMRMKFGRLNSSYVFSISTNKAYRTFGKK